MTNPTRLLGVLAMTAVLQGCIGIGVVGSERYERDLGDVFKRASLPLAVEQLVIQWGQPDEVEISANGAEQWTYESDLRWGGLLICVVVPVPLMLPIGRESTTLTVVDGMVTGAEKLGQSTTLYVAGVVPGPCYDYGVGVFHR